MAADTWMALSLLFIFYVVLGTLWVGYWLEQR